MMPRIQLPSVDEARVSYPDEEGYVVIPSADASRLRAIHTLMAEACSLLGALDNGTRNVLLDYHVEFHNLPHCLRFGEQAAEDVVGAIEGDKGYSCLGGDKCAAAGDGQHSSQCDRCGKAEPTSTLVGRSCNHDLCADCVEALIKGTILGYFAQDHAE
jgi:hypothetical protein